MFDFPNSPTVGQVYAPAGGPTWQWDGVAWKSFQSAGEMAIARTFIPGTAGTTTYVYNKPANLRHLEFEGVAAGGSGAPAIATGASVWSFGSGGGGGAWGKKLFNAAALPASVTITIGAPGAASSAGNGNTAADTTFGSLVTLPGGRAGSQGANTAYSSWGSVAGGAPTAYPTGVDVGRPGEGADGVSVSIAHSSAAGNVAAQVGRAGASPWGTVYYALYSTTGQSSGPGTGYGWGSGGSVNAGSAALRSSVAGGPGAVLLTEYLAVAPADVVQPARQTFNLAGLTTQNIPVPPGAKRARITGTVYGATGGLSPVIRLSADGTTYLSGASDYYNGGTALYSGSSASPTKIAMAAASYIVVAGYTDTTYLPIHLDVEINTVKGVATSAQYFNVRARSSSYHSAATALVQDHLTLGYAYATALLNITQLGGIQLTTTGTAFAAGSYITVDWVF